VFDFFKNSLANRLLFSFIGIGALPLVIFLVYALVLSEAKIVNKLIQDQHHELEVMKNRIDTHLSSLSKEVAFLARLDVMDDILSEDIDKRISRLLKQKQNDFHLNVSFNVINKEGIIIASSDINKILEEAFLTEPSWKKNGYVFLKKKLYIYSKIYASFEKEKYLGVLFVDYDLENINQYLKEAKGAYAYISNQDIYIGNKPDFELKIASHKGDFSVGDYLVVHQEMKAILKDWDLVYVLEKQNALGFFYDFIYLILYLSPFIFILTVLIAYKFSRYIIKPIEQLTQVTDEIILSKDYSKLLQMRSNDEVGRLVHSFNTLLKTTDKSLDASQAKSAFISNLSHELKTPLNAIIGFSQYLISYEDLSDEQLDIVSNIESSSQYLLEMIYGILDIAKIEAGKMDVHLQDLDLVVLAKDCFNMLEPLAEDKNLSFELDCINCDSIFCYSDAKIIKQILINLMSNAIKFTNEGSIYISLSETKEGCVVEVKDSGIGIEKEQIGKLFKDFSQIETTLVHKQKGTGLGLSLSKKLAKLIGGDIHLQSEGVEKGVRARLILKKETLG